MTVLGENSKSNAHDSNNIDGKPFALSFMRLRRKDDQNLHVALKRK